MRQRTSTLIVVAVILITFATVVITSALSSGDASESHVMPDGGTMQGDQMP